jgi:hypothetical protein
MTRRWKRLRLSSRQKPFSRKQRRRRRRQMKMRNRSRSTTTQIFVDAFDMLQISTESNIKPFEFIEREELTRQHALAMPEDQRPFIILRDNQALSTVSYA